MEPEERRRGRVVAYVRVSSRAQDHASQVSAIERAVRARGDVVDEWYGEKRSAKTLERPELARLRADARAGAFAKLYVFRLDRLTRSGIRDTLDVVDELRAHGVELVTLADGFDLGGPAAEVVLAVLAWAAKMERNAIGERIAAARERVEAAGGRWGRPSSVDRKTVARAATMRAQGRTLRAIAIALRVPRATIARALVSQKPPPGEPPKSPGKRARQQGASR